MNARKNEAPMSNSHRLTILETTVANINATLNDLRQDRREMYAKFDDFKRELHDLRIELKTEIRTEIKTETTLLRNEFKNDIKQLSDKMDAKFDTINHRLWSNFLWLMGMIIGLAGLIAHTQHWI